MGTTENNGELTGFEYNGLPYYYRKNIFGDIVEIYDDENQLAASYTYDAWGNFTVGTNVDGIAFVNKFRYRGYYYDSDTGYYYLQTRYYDPQVGRFLNADELQYLQPDSINGCNLYTYCLNNPVMEVDPMGTFRLGALSRLLYWVGRVVVGVVGIVAEGVRAAIDGKFDVFVEEVKSLDFNNDNEQDVCEAEYVSAYKGNLVLRFYNRTLTSWSVFGTLFINDRTVDKSGSSAGNARNENLIRHEWGHAQQELLIGSIPYLLGVALPSMTANLAARIFPSVLSVYNDLPWERSADVLGGVTRSSYSSWSAPVGTLYFIGLLFAGLAI